MSHLVVWTPQAREDLIEIYETIGLDNEAAAERVLSGIEKQVDLFGDFPRLGARRPEIADSARMLVFGVYLVLYKTIPNSDQGEVDEVRVVRVVHGHRELSRVF